MFVPNSRGTWLKKAARRTITGRETFEAGVPLPLSVIHISDSTTSSSVRADSSASRGAAEDTKAAAKFLVPPLFKVRLGDVVRINATLIEINGIEPRRDVFGKLDHFECVGDVRSAV